MFSVPNFNLQPLAFGLQLFPSSPHHCRSKKSRSIRTGTMQRRDLHSAGQLSAARDQSIRLFETPVHRHAGRRFDEQCLQLPDGLPRFAADDGCQPGRTFLGDGCGWLGPRDDPRRFLSSVQDANFWNFGRSHWPVIILDRNSQVCFHESMVAGRVIKTSRARCRARPAV